MATHKAVMRPALEYASSIWSPLASSTSIKGGGVYRIKKTFKMKYRVLISMLK